MMGRKKRLVRKVAVNEVLKSSKENKCCKHNNTNYGVVHCKLAKKTMNKGSKGTSGTGPRRK